jgi:hypothetical protein
MKNKKNYNKFESGDYDFNNLTADEKDMVTMDSAEYQDIKNEAHRTNKTLPSNALGMAITSLVLSCCCAAGIPFGIIAIVMASLSKDENGNRTEKARTAIIIAIVGIGISVLILLFYFIIFKDSIMSGSPEPSIEFLDQLIEKLEALESASGK